MKIVVTGGSGFVGKALVKVLLNDAKASDKIFIVDNLKRHGRNKDLNQILKDKRVKLIKADLAKDDLKKILPPKVDRIYHLAAIVGVGITMRDPAKVLAVNTLSTMKVFDWFIKDSAPKARILFSSSSEVYCGCEKYKGMMQIPTPEGVPFVVPDVGNPRYSYGLSKMWGEAYAKYLSFATKKTFVSVRYHNVYGPGMGYAHVIPQVIQRVCKKQNPFKIISPQQTRSFCWVEDAAELTKAVMESDVIKSGQAVHVGNPSEEIQVDLVYKYIFKYLDWSPKKTKIEPAPLGSVKRRCPNINLLKKVVKNYKFTPFKTGLQKTVQWYKEDLNVRNS